MKNKYIYILSTLFYLCFALSGHKTTIASIRNSPQSVEVPSYDPIKSYYTPLAQSGYQTDKLLRNVKVFPNQISDQLSLAFQLNRDAIVTIKIMDALGNEIITLLSKPLKAGLQNYPFSIEAKLNKGYYFVRVTAGSTQTVIKRIEVL